jgi:hypothetical protein
LEMIRESAPSSPALAECPAGAIFDSSFGNLTSRCISGFQSREADLNEAVLRAADAFACG